MALDGTPYRSTGERLCWLIHCLLMFPNFDPRLQRRGWLACTVNAWPSGQPQGKVSDDIEAIAGQAVEGLGL